MYLTRKALGGKGKIRRSLPKPGHAAEDVRTRDETFGIRTASSGSITTKHVSVWQQVKDSKDVYLRH